MLIESPNRCVILVPTLASPLPECDEALRELERRGYPVWRIQGYSAIDAARNQIATDALAQGFDELFWIDSDIAFNPNDVERLRQKDLPFACGLYAKKGARQFAANYLPGVETISFGAIGGLMEILYCGFGFTYTKRIVYETIHRELSLPICNAHFSTPLVPYFQPMVHCDSSATNWYLAEDLAFCERARRVGFKIFADTSIRLWHVGNYKYGWEDAGSDKERFDNYIFSVGKAPPK